MVQGITKTRISFSVLLHHPKIASHQIIELAFFNQQCIDIVIVLSHHHIFLIGNSLVGQPEKISRRIIRQLLLVTKCEIVHRKYPYIRLVTVNCQGLLIGKDGLIVQVITQQNISQIDEKIDVWDLKPRMVQKNMDGIGNA